jgi:glycosyltransferase involved in cell wall biosynthesis
MPGAALATARELPPILVLGDHLGYSGGVEHGVTKYFHHVLPALRAAGVNLTVCFLREAHVAAEPLHELGVHPVFLHAAKWNPLVTMDVVRLARECGARLLHVTGLKGTLVGRAAARAVDAPLIVHTHDLNEPGLAIRSLQRWLARPGDFGICVSEAVRELTVRGYRVAPARTVVIHNGIPLRDIQGIPANTRACVRAELGLAPHETVIGMLGRMHPVKGHAGMLHALSSVLRRCSRVTLLIIGDGPERKACEALARRLRLQEYVRFLGHRSDVARLLAAVDVVVMPSRSEGLGLAAVEAMAAGKPVVGFAVGGLREVVEDRVNGRLVPAEDHEAFVDALVELLQDEKQRYRYSECAVRDSARFSLESHVEQLIACYHRVVADYALRGTAAASGGLLE